MKTKSIRLRATDVNNVLVYDFRRPHRVSKERLRTLEAMYEPMVKSLESWIIGRIRGQIEMRLHSIQQLTFGEFIRSLPTPCASFVLDINDSGGQQGVIDIGQDFSFYLVDKLFGGSGLPIATNRPLSRVERLAVRSVVDRATTLLRDIWLDHIGLNFDVASFESVPDILLQNANRDDPVLVTQIDVIAGQVQSAMTISLPFSVLDRFFTNSGKRRLSTPTGSASERSTNRTIAEQSLRATRVAVSARLPEFKVSMKDLALLTEGSVLATGLPANSDINIRIGKQERFIAMPGKVAQQFAVRIQNTVQEFGAVRPAPDVSKQFAPAEMGDGRVSPPTFPPSVTTDKQ